MTDNLEYKLAAEECARYIFDSDCEQVSYQAYIEEGNDPRNHILYCAAVILDETKDFQNDIREFIKNENEASQT